jgi:hypothetical protein
VRIPNHPGNLDRNANRVPGLPTGTSPASGSSLMQKGRPHRVFSNVDVDRAPQDRGPGRNGITPATSGSSGANENAADTKPSRANVVAEHRGNAVVQTDKDKDINGTNNVMQRSHPGDGPGTSDKARVNSVRQRTEENSRPARTQESAPARANESPMPHPESMPHAEPIPSHAPAAQPAPHVEAPAPHVEAPHLSAPPPPPPAAPASHPPAESPSRRK